MTTSLRTCEDADRALLHDLRRQSEEWLAAKGLEQYQGEWSERAHRHIDSLLDDRRFVALCDGDDRVMAVCALVGPDRDFWTDEDDLHSSWYIGRLMVARHGVDAGGRLLDAVCLAAAVDGRRHLRLDCWRSNTRLHAYYQAQGFTRVRVVESPHRQSGALFQRPVRAVVPRSWDASWSGSLSCRTIRRIVRTLCRTPRPSRRQEA